MALINYVEPVNIGDVFMGIGSLFISLVVAFVLYRFYIKAVQWFDIAINKDAKYSLMEEFFLDKMAKEKGINLDQELIKRNMMHTEKKNFRKKVEEKVFEEMWGKDEKRK